MSRWTEYVDPRTECRRNRLFYEIGLSRTCLSSGVYDRSLLNLGYPRGYADDHFRREYSATAGTSDKILYHLLSHVILTDNAVFKRAHHVDILRVSAKHRLCILTDLGYHIGIGIHRHHRRLVENNTLSLHVNQNGSCSEIYSYVL